MIKFNTELLDYQLEGVEKLIHLKVGALFMEQGTGKTRTALELVRRRLDDSKVNRVLWLCPCTVKENLQNDIIKHCGELPTEIKICGIETLSSSIRVNIECIQYVTEGNCYLIVDESLLVKNPNALRTKNIIRLSQMCQYKLILNGTPISRTEADLFAQFYILDWRILGYKSYWSFSANHLEFDETGRIVRCLNTDYLAKKIEPYSYEVKKSDCVKLPNKIHYSRFYYISDIQQIEYDRVADKLLFELDEMEPATIYRLFSGLQLVISGMYVNTDTPHFVTKKIFANPLENPRIQQLLWLVDSKINDDKAIIFCKYKHEIDNIMKVLKNSVRFDGNVSQKNRDRNISKFRNESQFLVANKVCAGMGLNLQFCNKIIFYSNDWDYATRIQAEDRIYRLGQEKDCYIYDIVANGTLDNKIVRCLYKKQNALDSFKLWLKTLSNSENKRSWFNGKDL